MLAAVGRLGSTAAQLYNSLLIGLALPVSLLLLTSAAMMVCASVLAALLPRETARAALDKPVPPLLMTPGQSSSSIGNKELWYIRTCLRPS